MKSVCLYGGSFDPIHIAHLLLAQYACEILNIPQIIFVPAPIPPHKNPLTSFDTRLEMLKLATAGNNHFAISTIEEERGGISYTIDTVKYYLQNLGCDEVYLLMGVDSLLELPTWRSWQELLVLANIVAMLRPGCELDKVEREILNAVKLIKTPQLDISATDIRWRIENDRSIRYMVPETVREYITENKLYRQ